VRVHEFGPLAAPGAAGLFERPPQNGIGVHRLEEPLLCTLVFGDSEFTAGHLHERFELDPGTQVIAGWLSRILENEPVITPRRQVHRHLISAGTNPTPELVETMVRPSVRQPSG
jgi:beta-galactosidase